MVSEPNTGVDLTQIVGIWITTAAIIGGIIAKLAHSLFEKGRIVEENKAIITALELKVETLSGMVDDVREDNRGLIAQTRDVTDEIKEALTEVKTKISFIEGKINGLYKIKD